MNFVYTFRGLHVPNTVTITFETFPAGIEVSEKKRKGEISVPSFLYNTRKARGRE